jgi:methylated-DNA-[protein]-cysteine S-methyltransferase
MEEQFSKRLQQVMGEPPESDVIRSYRSVQEWFTQTAPSICWDVIESPIGPLYVAVSAKGLCRIDFDPDPADFLAHLDPLARSERNPSALADATRQLDEYFAGRRVTFDLALDLERVKPFQRAVLQIAQRIPLGKVWTYGRVAEALGKPQASRAVGQALAHNPVPVIVPCHRVIASGGGLGGYAGGLERKRRLLALEGAL